jgi:hypothetical protein
MWLIEEDENLRGCDCCGAGEDQNGVPYVYDTLRFVENEDMYYCKSCYDKCIGEWDIVEDDCGILSLYDPETKDWETMQDSCFECGALWGTCDCEDCECYEASATKEQIEKANKYVKK